MESRVFDKSPIGAIKLGNFLCTFASNTSSVVMGDVAVLVTSVVTKNCFG